LTLVIHPLGAWGGKINFKTATIPIAIGTPKGDLKLQLNNIFSPKEYTKSF